MRLTLRLSLTLICGVGLVSLAFAFFQTRADTRALKRDLESHAQVLADSLEKSAEPLLARHAYRELQRSLDRFRDREQIAGVVIYNSAGDVAALTPGLPARLGSDAGQMAKIAADQTSGFFDLGGIPMHVATVPVRDDDIPVGTLSLYHEAAYIERQAAAMWRRALTGVIIQTILIAAVTLLTIRLGVGRPMQRLTQRLAELRAGKPADLARTPEDGEFAPLEKEVSRIASTLTAARAAAEEEARLRDTAESTWTTERLRVFIQGRLRGARLFAVSNREPYEHFHRTSGIESSRPASGLVTALEPILCACDGTWIAQGTGDADRDTVDENDHIRVPPEHPLYTLRRVWLSKEEERGFYYGFANEGLWPLCHIAHTRPAFRAADWEYYEKVNRRFAAVVLQEIADEENPLVLAQDYHFALLPRLVKEKRPDARVAIFWHIPWPNAEAFSICPWRRELLDGLLGADLIGFHIQAHCNNFLETVDRTLESRIDREQFAVSRRGQRTFVRPFPISVAMDRPETDLHSSEEPAYMERMSLLAKLGVRASFLGVGVDRIDYTKGIPERFRAIETFLEKYPVYRGEFTFVQIGSPSRTEIERYHDLIQEVDHEAERINRRFQTSEWRPIVLLKRQHSHEEIQPYYRASDLCLVTSLHDGMNLVAKEFVAARADDQGVLILSQFAGASHELGDALIVNPYDTNEMADAIHRALQMSPEERRMRMQRMRAIVRERNIYRWAGSLIGELSDIRPPRVVGPALVRKVSGGA